MASVWVICYESSALLLSFSYSHANARYARLASICEPNSTTLRVAEQRFEALVPQPTQKGHPKVSFALAAELGFEPRHTESESAVLPLHNSARYKLEKQSTELALRAKVCKCITDAPTELTVTQFRQK